MPDPTPIVNPPAAGVVAKVTCPQCSRFFGVVTSDGRGPVFDACDAKPPPPDPNDPAVDAAVANRDYPAATAAYLRGRDTSSPFACPAEAILEPYQPKRPRTPRTPVRPRAGRARPRRAGDEPSSLQAQIARGREDAE